MASWIVRIRVSGRYWAFTRAAQAGRFLSIAKHPRHRLRIISDLDREERLIVSVRSGISFARYIGCRKRGDHAWFFESRARVKFREERVRMGASTGHAWSRAGKDAARSSV